MRPRRLTTVELVETLREIADLVEAGDSYEGAILNGLYRIGNLAGQGGMRMVGEV